MSKWATTCIIAGQTYTGCRVNIQDGEALLTNFAGSVDWSNSSNPIAQHVNRGKKGVPFGLIMVSQEQSIIQATLSAINTAQGSNSTFVVRHVEGLYDLNLNCILDYTQDWLKHGEMVEGWVENIVWKFIARSVVP